MERGAADVAPAQAPVLRKLLLVLAAAPGAELVQGSFGARSWAWPAVAIGVPPRRINEIVHGKRGITADTAVRLAKYFGNSAEFWMNLQSHYELRIERRALRAQVDAIQPIEHTS